MAQTNVIRIPFDPPAAIWSIIRKWAPDRGPAKTMILHKNDEGGVPATLIIASSQWMQDMSRSFLNDWDGRSDLATWKQWDKSIKQAVRWLVGQERIARKALQVVKMGGAQRVANRYMKTAGNLNDTDLEDLLAFANAFNNLGDAVQDQFRELLEGYTGGFLADMELNPHAVKMIKMKMGNMHGGIRAACIAWETRPGA